MKTVLSKMLYYLNFILLIAAFGGVLYGMIMTYKRLDKNLMDALYIFIPFGILFVIMIIEMFVSSKYIKNNLFLQLVSFIAFMAILIVTLRAKLDTNMLLYHKYGIGYNPLYLSDNLSFILSLLYFIVFANVLLLFKTFIFREKIKVEK